MSAQVHIQVPQDGNTVAANFTASGSVRPSDHTVRVRLTTTTPMQTSADTPATVNQSTGAWTAGPFKDMAGNLLNPAFGGVLVATSFTTNGIQADTDTVTPLVLVAATYGP